MTMGSHPTHSKTAPPEILSNRPGSFAYSVLHDRHPAIIEQVAAAIPYPPQILNALSQLRSELDGPIQPLPRSARDADDWDRWGRSHFGRTWYDVPFLWAESYFYRKLLNAVGYFEPGPWHGIDPFEPQKSAELRDPKLDADLAAHDTFHSLPPVQQIGAALTAAVWGNRADLGFLLSDPGATDRMHVGSLVVDDSGPLIDLLAGEGVESLCLVADNAGRELISDLILIDLLLSRRTVGKVDLHVKPRPYYVSDATTADLLACIRTLSQADTTLSVAQRLTEAVAEGDLRISAHRFYCAPLPFLDLPDDLRTTFSQADLVMFKGDLNYRRLVGDRDWPATTAFADLLEYFPTRVAALRTLKSDVAVGIDAHVLAALDTSGESWRTDGTRGLIQARL